MKTIANYTPPSPRDLAALKEKLEMTGAQMADLAVLAGANQWRKYTGGQAPRELGPHMLFLMAARLELDDDTLGRVFERMRDIGARFDFTEKRHDTPVPAPVAHPFEFKDGIADTPHALRWAMY